MDKILKEIEAMARELAARANSGCTSGVGQHCYCPACMDEWRASGRGSNLSDYLTINGD